MNSKILAYGRLAFIGTDIGRMIIKNLIRDVSGSGLLI
jgi:hypothetical protein